MQDFTYSFRPFSYAREFHANQDKSHIFVAAVMRIESSI